MTKVAELHTKLPSVAFDDVSAHNRNRMQGETLNSRIYAADQLRHASKTRVY